MKRSITFFALSAVTILITVQAFSCKVPESVTSKTGAQLWAENCVRCHSIPSPTDFSDDQWDLIGLHMKNRANLVQDEVDKIVEFLKSTNE